MSQYYVKTRSYEWDYDIEEREGSMCKEVGIITNKGFQDRCMAIAKGEWKPRANEPKCWFFSFNEEEL